MKVKNNKKESWIDKLKKAFKCENKGIVLSDDTNDYNSCLTETSEPIGIDMDDITSELSKAKDKKDTDVIKEKKIISKREKSQSLSKKEEYQKRSLKNKKAYIYYKASLIVTNNDYSMAKQLLAMKKIMLMDDKSDYIIDILAIDIAIDELDNVISIQHGEFTNNQKIK